MRTIHRTSLLALAIAASPFFASPAAAQQPGYWSDGRGAVVTNPNNLCWRTSYWTPALATMQCDPDLVPRAAPVAAPVPPAPPPAPAPPVAAPKPAPAPVVAAKPKRCDATVTFHADEYFVFDKVVLANPAARPRLEAEVRKRLDACATLEAIIIEGHTDRIGSQQVNQRLSEQRAEAAKAVLVRDLKIPADKIETLGMGKTLQIKSCPDAEFKTQKALIACLAPNRRVEINIRGVGK